MTRPAVTVLQLDTGFPRVPGDVACPTTYTVPVEVLRVPKARVGRIVTDAPMDIDITPFEDALRRARGDIVVTSCGFLAPWQAHLAALTDRPVIASALGALDRLSHLPPAALMILTFDGHALTKAHLGTHHAYEASIVGLPATHHLRDVIMHDRDQLDQTLAASQIAELVDTRRTAETRHVLLECTNLPPYKAAIKRRTGLSCSDILTEIATLRRGIVDPQFLPAPDCNDPTLPLSQSRNTPGAA